MAMSLEDAQRETFYDLQLEEFEKHIEKQKTETVANFISEGFTNSEDVTSGIVLELSKLVSSDHCQSIGFLVGALLETLERETLCLPLLVAGLGISEDDTDKIIQIKKMISKGVDSSNFTYRYFEDVYGNTSTINVQFDAIINRLVPNHKVFKSSSNLWNYREQIKSFRNYLAHGRHISTPVEADYMREFSLVWRDVVFNTILNKFKLKIDSQWMLVNI